MKDEKKQGEKYNYSIFGSPDDEETNKKLKTNSDSLITQLSKANLNSITYDEDASEKLGEALKQQEKYVKSLTLDETEKKEMLQRIKRVKRQLEQNPEISKSDFEKLDQAKNHISAIIENASDFRARAETTAQDDRNRLNTAKKNATDQFESIMEQLEDKGQINKDKGTAMQVGGGLTIVGAIATAVLVPFPAGIIAAACILAVGALVFDEGMKMSKDDKKIDKAPVTPEMPKPELDQSKQKQPEKSLSKDRETSASIGNLRPDSSPSQSLGDSRTLGK